MGLCHVCWTANTACTLFDTRGIAHLQKQRGKITWRDAPYVYGSLSTGGQGQTSIHVHARTGVEPRWTIEKM